ALRAAPPAALAPAPEPRAAAPMEDDEAPALLAAPQPAPAPLAREENDGLADRYPEFVAGLGDCLAYLATGAVDPGEAGQIMGGGASFTAFYPVMKQPFDFVVAFSETGEERSCSGQGPVSVPSEQVAEELPAVAAFFAGYTMVELNFPAPNRAFADCARDIGMLLTDSGGLTVFAGFSGQNATTYCTSFGAKE
ncbi:MAG: hypothetical protein AAF841_14825, partial [Pseudomonadota bacterium]